MVPAKGIPFFSQNSWMALVYSGLTSHLLTQTASFVWKVSAVFTSRSRSLSPERLGSATYQNPDLTPDERNAVWLELEHKYRPWIDFDNLPFYGRGAGWQRQLHIYECPFYYIDYCLSTMAALQFFLLSLKDHKDAWERYLKLVRRAGLASYTELMQTAGLKVPFEDGSIKAIAQQMGQWIAEHQV